MLETPRANHPVLGRPVRILLVEDSPSDAAMIIAAMEEATVANAVTVTTDGEAAIDYLRRTGPFADALLPDLVLLDLNLPRMDGREVLAMIKTDAELKRLPVIVLTTSSADSDIADAYDLHANGYVTKPVGFDAFFAMMHTIEAFWLGLVRLPPPASAPE